MEIIQTIISAFLSILTLFALTKFMGNRELSQLSMFDYINGITIGSIAAEMSTALFTDALKPFIAMVVYGVVIVAINIITDKSIILRRFINGRATILYNNDELYMYNLKKARIDLAEFQAQCRNSGYFDLSQLQTILLEANGKMSFLPKSDQKPLTAQDMNMKLNQEMLVANVIIDGKIMCDNLLHAGKDEKWLMHQLRAKGISNVSEVFLATCDVNNVLTIYKKNMQKKEIRILE